jgi:hypothetical protein
MFRVELNPAAHVVPFRPSRCPDHHLWRNGNVWWVAFTVHLPGWQKERIRLSLRTTDLGEARRRRDELLRRYPEGRECSLSLRFEPRRTMGPRGVFYQPPAAKAG